MDKSKIIKTVIKKIKKAKEDKQEFSPLVRKDIGLAY